MSIKKSIVAALIFGLIAGTAACGNSGGVKESGLSNIKTIKIAYLPLTHALPVFVEKELQDKKENKYKIELVKYGSWPELMDALNTGHVDGASVLIELAMKAKEQGIGVKAVALGHKDGNVIVVSKNIKSASDLKEKNFAIPHRQSSHNILLGQMLKNVGLSYKDVNIVELPPPEMPAALAQGQIAGYSVAEPFGAKSIALDTGKVLFESNELWKDSICCSLVLSDKFINSNKDVAKEVVSSFRDAGEYIGSHKDEANAIAKKYLNLDDKVLALSLKWISFNDLEITREAYDSLTSKIKEFGISSNPPAYDDFVDSSLLR